MKDLTVTSPPITFISIVHVSLFISLCQSETMKTRITLQPDLPLVVEPTLYIAIYKVDSEFCVIFTQYKIILVFIQIF